MKRRMVAGVGAGGYPEGVFSDNKFAINAGMTKVICWRADASVGLTFGSFRLKISALYMIMQVPYRLVLFLLRVYR